MSSMLRFTMCLRSVWAILMKLGKRLQNDLRSGGPRSIATVMRRVLRGCPPWMTCLSGELFWHSGSFFFRNALISALFGGGGDPSRGRPHRKAQGTPGARRALAETAHKRKKTDSECQKSRAKTQPQSCESCSCHIGLPRRALPPPLAAAARGSRGCIEPLISSLVT